MESVDPDSAADRVVESTEQNRNCRSRVDMRTYQARRCTKLGSHTARDLVFHASKSQSAVDGVDALATAPRRCDRLEWVYRYRR